MDGLQFTDCMVDVETTGLDTEHAAIIQIGAVPFNYDTKQIDTQNMFCRSLTMPKKRFWTSGTEKFWLQDNREVYMKIMADAMPYALILREFYDWSIARGDLRWWSKGWMDWGIVESYFNHAGLDIPYNFRQAKDMRSFIAGLNGEAEYHDPIVDKVGDHHNALHDCLTQLRQLFHAKENTCQSVVITD